MTRARPVSPRVRPTLVEAAEAEAESWRRDLTLLERWRRARIRWSRRGEGSADRCTYCGALPDKDCKKRCPTRQCGRCGGLGMVVDLNKRLGADRETGNPVYAGKPCTCQGGTG